LKLRERREKREERGEEVVDGEVGGYTIQRGYIHDTIQIRYDTTIQ
jgi:hypothetical protein